MNSSATKVVCLRDWIICEDLKSKLIETKGDRRFTDTVFAYLSISLNIPEKKLKKLDWENCFSLLNKAISETISIDIPIIKDMPQKGKESDWEYPGRTFNKYVNILAKAYGWSIDYIGNLEVNQAFALIQEIMTDDFLEQEFYYSLSEVAYPYNKSTKKSNYKPLEKPYWMKPLVPKQPKKLRIPKSVLPMGRVVDISGLPPEFQIEGFEVEKDK